MAGRARGRARAEAPVPTPPMPAAAVPAAPIQSGHGVVTADLANLNLNQPRRPSVGSSASGNGNGYEEPTVSVARGAKRGDRETREIHNLKPSNFSSKQGRSGTEVNLVVNYVKLNNTLHGGAFYVYHYNVTFDPPQDIESARRQMVYHHREKFGKKFVYRTASLFTCRLIGDTTDHPLTYSCDGVEGMAPGTFTLKLVGKVSSNSEVILQVFGILVNNCMRKLGYQCLGKIGNRGYYDFSPGALIRIPKHRVDLAPGYSTAIHQHETDVLMCINVKHKVLRTVTVLDVFRDRQKKDPAGFALFLESFCETVVTKYNMDKTYRVTSVDVEKNPTHTFSGRKDGAEVSMTYVEYYRAKYRLEITDLTQPLLVCRPSKKDMRGGRTDNIYLVPELCFLTGMDEAMRNDIFFKRDMIAETSLDPNKMKLRLDAVLAKLIAKPEIQMDLGDWDLAFEEQLLELKGRNLGQQKIIMGDVQRMSGDKSDWNAMFRDLRLEKPAKLKNWLVIAVKNDEKVANDFIASFNRVIRPFGLDYEPPKLCLIADERTQSFQSCMHENNVTREDKPIQFVCLIFPNLKSERYNNIKQYLCNTYGVPSQVVLTKTLTKGASNMSVVTKVAMQINCKLGGALWRTEIPTAKTMIVGYDTYHSGKGKNAKSLGAIVATVNQHCTQFYSTVAVHDSREELSSKMQPMFSKCLMAYQAYNNGEFPSRVIFYRDGVGEGQIHQVKQTELAAITSALGKAAPDAKLLYIVVSKGINTRILKKVSATSLINPSPGTVLDHGVTIPEYYDFFLVSQCVRQGTVCPTNYNIIEDTGAGLDADKIQMLTYRLTHQYFNWAGTIRVPAHCLLAHKLAFLTGQSLECKEAKQDLHHQLYYL